HSNGQTILMFSSDGSPLTSETLFDYTGDLVVESALVADWSGNGVYADLETVPDAFTLSPAYPNPFNPVTTVSYSLPEDSDVALAVYDLAGKRVEQLVSGPQPAGSYTVSWDAGAQASGVYFIVLQSGATRLQQKVVLLK
ncbi:MAG: T9SS type A sorting domain-containing protein, partial [FCB group bacterium]|nr:T9SS type A sorting domain-containing protein [FCB group bacterium]